MLYTIQRDETILCNKCLMRSLILTWRPPICVARGIRTQVPMDARQSLLALSLHTCKDATKRDVRREHWGPHANAITSTNLLQPPSIPQSVDMAIFTIPIDSWSIFTDNRTAIFTNRLESVGCSRVKSIEIRALVDTTHRPSFRPPIAHQSGETGYRDSSPGKQRTACTALAHRPE